MSKIGPYPTDNVWLTNSWSDVAHRLTDTKDWDRTGCGKLTIIDVHLLGRSIRWDSLNQERIRLCKVCWKGYETPPVPSVMRNELAWWWAQNKLVAEIFSEAWVVASVPTHLDDFAHDSAGNLATRGGNVVARGTMLNYDTLKSMLTIMLQEETHRKISRGRMVKLMEDLVRWERTHPFGEPVVEEEPEDNVVVVGILEP